jgi:hypothetical protein
MKKKKTHGGAVGTIAVELEDKTRMGPAEIAPSISGVPWAVAFCVLSLLLVVLVWFPIANIPARYGSAEGQDAYFQQAAASGAPLYGKPPGYFYLMYTPLSFHLIGWLGHITHNLNVTGRWVSFLAYLLIGVLTALIVQRLSNSWRYASYAGLCWLIWIAAFDPARIGLNDPHVLGMAVNLAGLYCFVRDPDSTRGLCWSAVVFAISLFTKQTLLAFPIAVGIQLLLTSRRRLGIWLGAAASACVILLLLTLAIDGTYLFGHLLVSRTYSLQDMANNTGKYLLFIQVAFVAALIWLFRNMFTNTGSGLSRVLIWSFACAHVMGAAASGGNGASVNHLFDAMVATALIAGVALPGLERLAEGTRFPRAFLAVLLIVPFFFSSIMVLPWRIPRDLARHRTESPQLEAEFAAATSFLRTVPDPVLCESALLCYESGKAFTYDAFAVDQAIQTGHMPAQAVLDLIRGRHFKAVEIDFDAAETIRPAARGRFPAEFMRLLLTNYRLALRTSSYAIFTPNPA